MILGYPKSLSYELKKKLRFFSLFFCLDAKEPKNQGLQKALVAHAITFFINSCRRWFLCRLDNCSATKNNLLT
jgi:hypothetical protein